MINGIATETVYYPKFSAYKNSKVQYILWLTTQSLISIVGW